MTDIRFEYRPLPVHYAFHQSSAYERALFGAFGSGKTYSLCAEAIAICLSHPGIRGLIARFTVPELRDTTETVFFDILPHSLRQAGEISRTGGHVASYTFPNGSKVLFRGIDDWQKHKSLNIGFIAFDEADEFDLETYEGMKSRVRQVDPTTEAVERGFTAKISRRYIISASNPAGHNWLWHRFISPDRKHPEDKEYFTSTSFDNPYLPASYIDSLLEYPEPWIRRYVLCQFDDFAGQIYEDWSYDRHVIPAPGAWPQETVYWMGFDPGTRSGNAGLWVAVDRPNRRLVGVGEYLDTGMSAEAHAQQWRKLEGKLRIPRVQRRIADPSIRIRDRGSNMSLESQYTRLGFNFTLGTNDEKARIQSLGALITQGRFVLTDRCMQTFEQIRDYQWQDLTPTMRARGEDAPEKPLKRHVDLVDAAQYVATQYIQPSKMDLELPKDDSVSSWAWSHAKKMIRDKGSSRPHDLGTIQV